MKSSVIALYGQGVSRYITINEYPPMTRFSLSTFLFKVPRQCSGSINITPGMCSRQNAVTKTEDDDEQEIIKGDYQ